MKSRKEEIAIQIIKILQKEGHTAYFAGGCVRDSILKVPAKDYDVATSATPEQVEKLFEKTVPVGKQFGVMLAIIEGEQFEIATFRKEGGYQDGRHPSWVKKSDPEEDAKRRDFTVNGLFYDPVKNKIIDYVGGAEDIHNRLISTIGKAEERFSEDKLRLIRAVRFASTLNFKIEEETWFTLKKMVPEIKQVSSERIRDELVKIFTRPNAGLGLELLSESGLLKELLPEIEAMKGCEQAPDYHPEGDVFVHTKLLLDKMENPTPTLAFSCLLHDVGKPPTFHRDGEKIHFYEHDRIGADMSREILTRLRFSNKEIEAIVSAVSNHMRFMHVKEMRQGKLKTFLSRDTFKEELELHRIDCSSSHGKLDNYEFLNAKLQEFKADELKPKPFLTGHRLMAAGLSAGPVMGQIIKEGYDLQLEGRFKNDDEAVLWAKERWKQLVDTE